MGSEELSGAIALRREVNDALGPAPDEEEMRNLLVVMNDVTSDEATRIRARESIILAHHWFVEFIARRYARVTGIDLGDLIHEGYIGLIRGVERLDPASEFKTTALLGYYIRVSITRALFRYQDIRIPEWLYSLMRKYREIIQDNEAKPPAKMIARTLGVSLKKVRDLEVWYELLYVERLEEPLREGEETEKGDFIGDEVDYARTLDEGRLAEILGEAMEELDEFERSILLLNFFEGKNIPQIASLLESDVVTIRNTRKRILTKLRNPRIRMRLRDFL